MRERPSPYSQPDLGFALHQLVCAALPMRTAVESIPAAFVGMQGRPFPILFSNLHELTSILSTQYGHVLSFTHNRAGQVFAEPVFPPDTPMERIVPPRATGRRLYAAKKQGGPALPPPAVEPVIPAGEQALLVNAVMRLLTLSPELGEAAHLEGLFGQIDEAFFRAFRVPLRGGAGDIIKQIGRIEQEPVTGRVSLRLVGKEVPPLRPTSAAAKRPPPHPAEHVFRTLQQLRTQLLANLDLIDSALTRGSAHCVIPDVPLWTDAVQTLFTQETQAREILTNLFKQE